MIGPGTTILSSAIHFVSGHLICSSLMPFFYTIQRDCEIDMLLRKNTSTFSACSDHRWLLLRSPSGPPLGLLIVLVQVRIRIGHIFVHYAEEHLLNTTSMHERLTHEYCINEGVSQNYVGKSVVSLLSIHTIGEEREECGYGCEL
jgi:hypothetical protein